MKRMLLLSASLLSLAAAPASAQGTNDQDTDDSIIVTATRLPTPAARLPADVTIIDVDDALQRGEPTLVEALQDIPGFGVVRLGPIGQQTSLFAGGANSNHTLVLFDGLRINDPSTPGSSFDAGQDPLGGLTRIEIVQGPMSALYGSDAIGGVVNLIPRHGGEGAVNARLDFATGSFDTLMGAAGIDGTLGAFRYALSAEGYASEGYDIVPERMATHTGDPDGAESLTMTGVFDLALSDRFTLDLLVRHRTARADFDAFPFDFGTFAEFRADDPDLEISRNDLTLARLGATWRLSDAFSLRATAGGTRQNRAQTDNGATDLTYEGERRFADAILDWRAGAAGVMTDAGVSLGIVAEVEEVDIFEFFGFPPASTVVEEQDHRGAFATAQGSFGNLTLTGAVRIDDYEGFGTETTWRAGASYNVLENARLYAAYGTSYRAPTLYERFVSFGDPNLLPEEGESWEIGGDIRFAAFGRENGVTLGALYRSTSIEHLINFNAFFTYDNVDLAEIESAEVRMGLRPFEWLTAEVAYTYTDARDATDSAQLLRRPEHQWSASLIFERGAFSGLVGWRRVGERTDRIYGDDGFDDGIGLAPAYDVVRASAAWEFTEGAQLYVAADNLFDEAYEPASAFAGAPRNVMVGVRLAP